MTGNGMTDVLFRANALSWFAEHTMAINADFLTTLDLSSKLTEFSIDELDREKASIMEAAAVRMLELTEMIDRLRAECPK